MSDQAAGLRRWAQARQATAEDASADEMSAAEERVVEETVVDSSVMESPADAAEASEPVGAPGADVAPEPEPEPEPEPVPTIPLMVLGLPNTDGVERAQAALARWAHQGQRWIGDPAAWQVVACDAESPQLARLARQQPRWALWIDTEGDGFRQAFKVMQAVRRGGGPRRLLALHPPVASRRGLLNNLRQVAREAFEIDLMVLTP